MTISFDCGRYLPEPGRHPALRNVTLTASAKGVSYKTGKVSGSGLLAMPPPVNAHDHGYGIRTLGFGCLDDALESWIAGLRLRPRTDPYLEALVAFGRLAAGGIGATTHCHNSHNADRLVEEAGDVVRAARSVGIRLALSCPLLDRDPWIYGGPELLCQTMDDSAWTELAPLLPSYRPIHEQMAAVDAIADSHSGPMVDVQYGPIGPQWCSDDLLEAIAEASARTGRRIHMHLLESPRQRTWLHQRFPGGIVQHLDEIGFLSPRLAIAHGVQLEPVEIEILAERGVCLVSNPSANLRLRSGIAPLQRANGAGLQLAFGLDGTGLDDDQDLWRELRLAWLLHGGRGMKRSMTAADLFAAAISNGALVVNQPTDKDLVVIAYDEMTSDFLFDDLDEAEVLLTRMNFAHVTGLIVEGEWILRNRRLQNIDFDAANRELRQQALADLPRLEAERPRTRNLADAIRHHYAGLE